MDALRKIMVVLADSAVGRVTVKGRLRGFVRFSAT
jgi:hypothetical protein